MLDFRCQPLDTAHLGDHQRTATGGFFVDALRTADGSLGAGRHGLRGGGHFVHRGRDLLDLRALFADRLVALPGNLLDLPRLALDFADGMADTLEQLADARHGRIEHLPEFAQLVAADHAPLHAEAAHQFHSMGRVVKGLLVGVEVRDAAFQPVVLDARGAHYVLECGMAVRAQRHDLLHVACEGRVVALRQELQAPAPLLPVQLGAKQQRRFLVEHPLEGLPWRLAVGPGLTVAHRDLRRVGKTGLQRRVGLAVDHSDFMPALAQMPGGANADDAGAQDDGFHGAQCAAAQ